MLILFAFLLGIAAGLAGAVIDTYGGSWLRGQLAATTKSASVVFVAVSR